MAKGYAPTSAIEIHQGKRMTKPKTIEVPEELLRDLDDLITAPLECLQYPRVHERCCELHQIIESLLANQAQGEGKNQE